MTGANSVAGLLLVYVASSGMGYYVSKGFFDTIPRSLDEAARVDNHDIAFLRTFVIEFMPVAVQLRGHNFRIHNVLGTSQGDDIDGHNVRISVGKDTKKKPLCRGSFSSVKHYMEVVHLTSVVMPKTVTELL